MNDLITEHLDTWTSAITSKATAGRGTSDKQTAYGIKKLRELILELAVRGKLVPQESKDEPASELLKRIQVEKAKLIAEGKIKKDKLLPPLTDIEKPFDLPLGWEWARLGNFVLSILSGGTPSKNNSEFWNGDIPWASVKDLNVEKFLETTQDSITKEGLEAGSKLAKKGDLLICTRMGLGKIAIASIDVAINQDLKALKITSLLDVDYFIHFYSTLKIIGSGMTVAGIKQDELLSYCIPTPPLAEQHRIVAKVDELMALCDQLEQQQSDSIAAHQTLVQTLLGTLTQAADAAEFEQAWSRIADHFDTLFTTEHCIDQLKQTLLQLAVMGKLVPQDPIDEPASMLLEKITQEKLALIKEGKLSYQKQLPQISSEERAFSLPYGWAWVRFIDLAREISTGPFGTMVHKQDYIIGGTPLINPSHMIDSKISEDNSVTVASQKAEELSSYKLGEGDIVLARRGEMGRCALVTQRESGWLCGTGSFFIRFNENICREFVLLLFKSQHIRDYLGGESVGATMTNLNHGILNKMPVAIPPVQEQHRIVAKVDELMALCDALKARIAAAQTTQIQLADAIVEQAVA